MKTAALANSRQLRRVSVSAGYQLAASMIFSTSAFVPMSATLSGSPGVPYAACVVPGMSSSEECRWLHLQTAGMTR